MVDFASYCSGPAFSGTGLIQCDQIGKDIATCQAQGVRVLLSLGGATGVTGFTDATQASAFADTLWNTFGNGNSNQRPFGTASVDGFDLDIEGGSPAYYSSMVTQLRKRYTEDTSRTYYVTAAPQCVFPDAHLSQVLDSSPIDMVFVQFYNNPCSIDKTFNYDVWDTWAKTAPNPNVQIYIGVPAAPAAAGSGFVASDVLTPAVLAVQSKYSSFGGVMMWDTSFLDASDPSNLLKGIKASMSSGASPATNAKLAVVPKPSTTLATAASLAAAAVVAPTVSTLTPVVQNPTAQGLAPGLQTTSCDTCASTIKVYTTIKTTTTVAIAAAAGGTSTAPAVPIASTTAAAAAAAAADTTTITTFVPSQVTSCSTNGQMQCVGTGFGTCDNGTWVVRACAVGTQCKSVDAHSIVCDHATTTPPSVRRKRGHRHPKA